MKHGTTSTMVHAQSVMLMNKYIKFWDWFKSRSEYIYNNLEIDTDNIALEITENIKLVNQDLEFEIPLEFLDDTRELIISADGLEKLFNVVIELVKSAPIINNWRITAFRPRLHQRNQRIDLDGISMDYFDIFFTYIEQNQGIELKAYIADYDGIDNRYVHLYFLLLDSLIGEYDSVKCIASTKVFPLLNKTDLHSFSELLEIVDNYKKKIIEPKK